MGYGHIVQLQQSLQRHHMQLLQQQLKYICREFEGLPAKPPDEACSAPCAAAPLQCRAQQAEMEASTTASSWRHAPLPAANQVQPISRPGFPNAHRQGQPPPQRAAAARALSCGGGAMPNSNSRRLRLSLSPMHGTCLPSQCMESVRLFNAWACEWADHW